MPILRQRPKLGPVLVTALVVASTCALGTWQVKRLEWKNALIESVESKLQLPPTVLPDETVNADEWAYRRVAVSGRYLFDKEHFVQGISPRGELGYRVMTPLLQPGGTIVLVERAWIPVDARRSSKIESSAEIEVLGMVRIPQAPSWTEKLFTPEPDTQARIWYRVDLEGASEVLKLALQPFFLEAAPVGRQDELAPATFRLQRIPNNHLAYAITWYALALCCIAIFVLYHRRKEGS